MKMKTLATNKRTVVAKGRTGGLAVLITEFRQLIRTARRNVSTVVDTLQVMTNFEIGRRIVEHEQRGAKRAKYGTELLKALSARLTREFGKGFSVTNLKLMRQFFAENQHRIGQQATDQLAREEYQLYLPSKELLRQKLLDWTRDVEASV
jgi:hypothetical protein